MGASVASLALGRPINTKAEGCAVSALVNGVGQDGFSIKDIFWKVTEDMAASLQ
jgi:hypothetical protein